MFNVADRTILLTVAGSWAYGTNRPDSDVDVKGVCVPPEAYRSGFVNRFEQADKAEHLAPFMSRLPTAQREAAATQGKLDGVIFDIRKFFALAADCNPNVIETLFVDPADIVHATEEGRVLLANRDFFLSKKALYTFRGYAISQLKRIETHRRWLLDPKDRQPTREDFDLPEYTAIPKDQLAAAQAAIQKRLDTSWESDLADVDDAVRIQLRERVSSWLAELEIAAGDQFRAAGNLLGYDSNFLEHLDRERRYNAAKHDWTNHQTWKTQRNPARAAMEAESGYDRKHASHLVRLFLSCREILTEGTLHVRRPDAAFLRDIMNGAWTYERLTSWAKAQDAELVEIAKTSKLPHGPDRVYLDSVCQQLTKSVECRYGQAD